MSFFIKKKNKGKQGPGQSRDATPGKRGGAPQKSQPNRKKFKGAHEEIDSDSDISDTEVRGRDEDYSSAEEDRETAAEKKLRLAKQYLAQIEVEEREKQADEDLNRDLVSHRLKQDRLEQTGRFQRQVAENVEPPSPDDLIIFRGHQLSVTCVVISPDCQHVYSAGKDCSIIKWSMKERKKVHVVPGGRKGTEERHTGHTDHVMAMALTSDEKYLATGDKNKLIHIWEPASMKLLHTFRGHRDTVSGLTFRKDSHQLFSCSHDRSVKIWNVDERAYVETLFGHQDKITAIDSLSRERCVTAGGRDSSVRIWKIIEESQLVFNAHNLCSVDCVALINESNLISGADDNSLSLWSVMKKKPICTRKKAHGWHDNGSNNSDTNNNNNNDNGAAKGVGVGGGDVGENWITAVAALHSSDLVASGSKDGCVRLWRCNADEKKIVPLFSVPVRGFVNSLSFSRDGQLLVAGVGQEHRLGRWWTQKAAKNGVVIIPLKHKPKQ